ncbi:MAG: hypothetical protein JW709_11370 [Sedimentisphaerales bacterium]|nr:hypothetical protein [Sedimentisphaerales bacterium]
MKNIWILMILTVAMLASALPAQPTPDSYPLMVGTYVEGYANSEADYNVWPTDAGSYPLLTDWLIDPEETGKWWPKTASSKCIYGTAFEGKDYNQCPQLTMTATGLDDTKTYDIYVVYWPKYLDWSCWAALPGGLMRECTATNGDVAFFDDGGTGVQGRQAFLGQVTGQTSVSILVEAPPDQPGDDRAWLDGLSYDEATPRSSVTLTIENPVLQDPNNFGTVTPLPEQYPIAPAVGTYNLLQGQTVTLGAPDFTICPDRFEFVGWVEMNPGTPPVVQEDTGSYSGHYIVMTASETLTPVYRVVEYTKECGDECHPIYEGDINQNCLIDMEDLLILIANWLTDNRPIVH